VKVSEIRDKNEEELATLEKELRDQIVKIEVARATQRATNTAQLGRLRKDIARILTVRRERALGLAGQEAST
jgi:large subunit ribosomal protein L29